MRIISGYLRGRKIIQPSNKLTRPLKDLTKESIFNILLHSNLITFDLKKSEILDLFSCVGSFGLECISRGAQRVVFCENSTEALIVLKKNIINLNCQQKSQVIEKNVFNIKKIKSKINNRYKLFIVIFFIISFIFQIIS